MTPNIGIKSEIGNYIVVAIKTTHVVLENNGKTINLSFKEVENLFGV